MNKKTAEMRRGVILSYGLIVANIIYGLLLTPFILKYVGESSYGVYKTVASLSASLSIMDLGLSSTMTRYMAKFNAQKDKQGACNFVAMIFIQFAALAVAILIIGIVIYCSLDLIYANSFNTEELELAKIAIVFLILNMIFRLLENLESGISTGCEHFTFSNGVKLASVILKFLLILVILPIIKNVLVIVYSESIIVVLAVILFFIYNAKRVGIIPKLIKWDNVIFKESFGYTALSFVQTITVQFNGNVDNIVIGAGIGAVSVTIYSMAIYLYGMYENLSGSIANIMLPNMTKRVLNSQSPEELQDGVEKAGRFQFMILAAALGGFVVLGKDFFLLWLGNNYIDCYYLSLILIIPVTLTMSQNVCLSVLRAQNKMVYRTVTLAISCAINLTLTIIGIHLIGYWGAAIGTAIATISNLIFMNIYYKKNLDFKIIPMFLRIFKGTWLCALISSIITYGIHHFIHLSWISFIICAFVYIVIYILLLFRFGLKDYEKKILLGKFSRGE